MKFQEIWKTQTFIAVIDSIVCCFSVELKKKTTILHFIGENPDTLIVQRKMMRGLSLGDF